MYIEECLLSAYQILFESLLWSRGVERVIKYDSYYNQSAACMMDAIEVSRNVMEQRES